MAMVDDLIKKFQIDQSKIILITPPPVNRIMLEELEKKNNGIGACSSQPVAHVNASTSLYASACRDVGEMEGVTVLDIFSDMLNCECRMLDVDKTAALELQQHSLMSVNEFVASDKPDSATESPSDPLWHSYLCDGIHFSRSGSEFLFSRLWPMIEQRVEALPFKYSHWRDVDEHDPMGSLKNVNVYYKDFKLD